MSFRRNILASGYGVYRYCNKLCNNYGTLCSPYQNTILLYSIIITITEIIVHLTTLCQMALPMMSRLMRNTMMKKSHIKKRSRTLATFFHSPMRLCVARWSR